MEHTHNLYTLITCYLLADHFHCSKEEKSHATLRYHVAADSSPDWSQEAYTPAAAAEAAEAETLSRRRY